MDPIPLARSVAAGRIAFGGALVLAPGLVGQAWLGPDAHRPAARAALVAMGARDAAIGAGALAALASGRPVAPWLRAGAVSDVADFLVSLRALRDLPPAGALVVAAIAGTGAALGGWLQANVP